MTYHIRLEQFEGPLDLLLQLTQQDKLDITRVSLAKIADEYLEFVNKSENISLLNLSDFLSVAAKLILIKSKALLPLLEFTQEEEEEIKDLENQLVEYKKFKDIAKEIEVLFSQEKNSYSRESFFGQNIFFYPPENLTKDDLKKIFIKILGEIPVKEKLEEEMIKDVLTLEDRIQHLQNTLKKRVQTSFSQLISDAKDKVEIVVSFLAILELVKQKIINVEQDGLFSEIHLRHKAENKNNTNLITK